MACDRVSVFREGQCGLDRICDAILWFGSLDSPDCPLDAGLGCLEAHDSAGEFWLWEPDGRLFYLGRGVECVRE